MEIDAFLDLVHRRRSVRSFKPDAIPDGSVEKILEAARWAMSGANGQPWEFVVVRDQKLREGIVRVFEGSRAHVRIIEETRAKELRHPAFSGATDDVGWRNAPVFIVVCSDPRTLQATVLSSHFYMGEGAPLATYLKNVANATQLIHLAAAACGLGAQWVSVNNTWEAPVKELLGIPPVLNVHTIVPIGYPVSKLAPPYRRKLNEVVHYDVYDKSRARSDEQIQEFLALLRQRTVPSYKV